MRKRMDKVFAFIAIAVMSLCAHLASHAQNDKVYLEEHFDKFKAGTEDTYDKDTLDNKLDEYTSMPGWMGLGIYQAGGSCALVQDAQMYSAQFRTPKLTTSGWVKIELRARIFPSIDSEEETLSVYSSNAYWDIEQEDLTVTKEWKNFSFVMKRDGEFNYTFLYSSYEKEGVVIQLDDIKISATEAEAAKAPQALPATDLTSTGFTANWSVVSGADKYLLSVYENVDGEKKFLFEDKDVALGTEGDDLTKTSYKVEGLAPSKFYAYYLKTQIGEDVSEPSTGVDVYNMVTPVAKPATDITADGFVAHWEKTVKADKYNVAYYRYMPKWGRVKIGTIEVPNGDATSVAITGLSDKNATCFSYEVAAVSTVAETPVVSTASDKQFVVMHKQTEREVLAEDFSRFAKGSMDDIYYKPTDPNDPRSTGEYVNDFKSRVIPDSYTQVGGWTGFGVLEAGGVAAVSYRTRPGDNHGGELITPALSAEGGLVKVSFRLKSIDQYAPASEESPVVVGVEPVDGNNYGIDADCFDGASEVVLTDNEWHDCSLTCYVKEGKFFINFGLGYYDHQPFFIDDIKVSLLSDDATGIREVEGSLNDLNVRTVAGGIVVEAGQASPVNVFNAAGQLVKTVKAEAGENIISLPKGLYIVKTPVKTVKVVSHD